MDDQNLLEILAAAIAAGGAFPAARCVRVRPGATMHRCDAPALWTTYMLDGTAMDTPNLPQILPTVIAVVERTGAPLAAECVRPGGRRSVGDKADIDVEIETQLRAELLAILDCDW